MGGVSKKSMRFFLEQPEDYGYIAHGLSSGQANAMSIDIINSKSFRKNGLALRPVGRIGIRGLE